MRRFNDHPALSEVMPATVNPHVLSWMTANVLPFDAELRNRLRRLCATPGDVDDLVQDVYCRILNTGSVAHIVNPRGFVVQVAKNILVDQCRRDAVVRIDLLASLDEFEMAASAPSTERVAMARCELRTVLGLIAHLPGRCRDVFSARKIDGLSQTETAARLGVSENVVEKEMVKGARLIAEMAGHDGVGRQACLAQEFMAGRRAM